MKMIALFPFLVFSTLTARGLAAGDVPVCSGYDPAAAAAAKEAGIAKYKRSARKGAADPDMLAALASFDAACAAGDTLSLELRAYALAALGRFVDAARSLDALTTTTPLAKLPAAVQARIEAASTEIFGRVATLSIETSPPDLPVVVDHVPRGATPLVRLRLEPGDHDVEISSGSGSQARTLHLEPGVHTETFTFAPPESAVTTSHPLRPWAIAAGGAGVALLGVALGATVWRTSNADYYNASGCTWSPTRADCANAKAQYQNAFSLQITSLVAGGALAVVGVALFVFDTVRASNGEKSQRVACGFAATGAVCAGRF